MENLNDPIANQTCDLLICAVPQLIGPSHVTISG